MSEPVTPLKCSPSSSVVGDTASVAVSVVSHGHGALIVGLIRQLATLAEPCLRTVIVTLNVPEPAVDAELSALAPLPFVLEIIRNTSPKGFGANHNAALTLACQRPEHHYVCVLNPDIRMQSVAPLHRMSQALINQPSAGLAYPMLLDESGHLQDSEREIPGFMQLWRRRVLKQPEQRVDWVSGACMLLHSRDWQHLGGFDEHFFMYCEDVDLSLRVRRDVGTLVPTDVKMVHLAQRASHKRLNHLFWHVRSLLQLWCKPSFRWAKQHPATAKRTALS